MTTLSKEEFKLLLSNSVASPDLDKVQDAIADLVAENERLKALSVTNIMVDVVPGDGSGLEVYAKSVDEVVNLLSELGEKAEDLESVRAQLIATWYALAAADADNERLCEALSMHIHLVESNAPELSGKAHGFAKDAVAQPRDDSALREILKEAKFEGRQELLQFIRHNNYVCTKPGIVTGAPYKLYFLPEE